jgi:hypothetical protein
MMRGSVADGAIISENERANAYGQILRITARAATRKVTSPVSIYARMGTTPAASTFTAWL